MATDCGDHVIALWVFCAGALGSTLRYCTDVIVRRLFGPDLPYGTVIVNVAGSVLIGWVTGVIVFHHPFATVSSGDLNTVVAIGFCGGLTTWSTASFETIRLFEEKRPATAAAFTAGTFALALVGGFIGLTLAA